MLPAFDYADYWNDLITFHKLQISKVIEIERSSVTLKDAVPIDLH